MRLFRFLTNIFNHYAHRCKALGSGFLAMRAGLAILLLGLVLRLPAQDIFAHHLPSHHLTAEDTFTPNTCMLGEIAPRVIAVKCQEGLYVGWLQERDLGEWIGYALCTKTNSCHEDVMIFLRKPGATTIEKGTEAECSQFATVIKCDIADKP